MENINNNDNNDMNNNNNDNNNINCEIDYEIDLIKYYIDFEEYNKLQDYISKGFIKLEYYKDRLIKVIIDYTFKIQSKNDYVKIKHYYNDGIIPIILYNDKCYIATANIISTYRNKYKCRNYNRLRTAIQTYGYNNRDSIIIIKNISYPIQLKPYLSIKTKLIELSHFIKIKSTLKELLYKYNIVIDYDLFLIY